MTTATKVRGIARAVLNLVIPSRHIAGCCGCASTTITYVTRATDTGWTDYESWCTPCHAANTYQPGTEAARIGVDVRDVTFAEMDQILDCLTATEWVTVA